MPRNDVRNGTLARRIAYVILSLSALFLCGAVGSYIHAQGKLANWERADAEVVSFEHLKHRTNRSTTWLYHPNFRFTDSKGRSHTITDDCGKKHPTWVRGARVPILYPADNPQKAEIHCFSNLYTLCIVLSCFCGFTALLGGGFNYVSRRAS